MKAMKDIWPGYSLPLSRLTNSQGFEVEGEAPDPDVVMQSGATGSQRYYPPLPVYFMLQRKNPPFDAVARPCVARWTFSRRERLSVLWRTVWGDTAGRYDLRGDPMLRTEVCFVRAEGGKRPGEMVLRSVSLPFMEWTRFLLRGSLWQILDCVDGRFVPVWLGGAVPVSLREDIAGRATYPYTRIASITMGGRDMVPKGGIGEIAVVYFSHGKYSLDGYGDAGTFHTEDAALEWLAKKLQAQNKKQWSSAHDVLSYAGQPNDWLPTLTCPVCALALTRITGKWQCPKCRGIFVVTDRNAGTVEAVDASFKAEMVAAGFSETQAAALWKMHREVK